MRAERPLILASGSPRRRNFLTDLELDFAVLTADLDESPLPGERPAALARRLAEAKAHAVADRYNAAPRPGGSPLIIAADTVVALENELFGKPADADEVFAMLAALRGKVHDVITAVAVLNCADGRLHTRINAARVHMRAYSDDEIWGYIGTGDPFDKAGAYAIQHAGFHPARAISGCISAVIGLPLADLRDLLAECGVNVAAALPPICRRETGFSCCQDMPEQLLDVQSQ